jgi:alkylation response protein AidB-like acyl-CoA dehydrogenase
MELRYEPADLAFREEVRAWLHDNVPREKMPVPLPEQREYLLAWQRKQYDAGWAGIAWPEAYGGRGLSLVRQLIWYEEYVRAHAPPTGCLFVGLNHGGPTLIVRGNAQQKAFHLASILRGEVIWCQGFSEPSSGSDLASLRTRATIEDDHLVVNGQKIWTSFGNIAEYQELLVRTQPGSSRHHGLTWVICDMRTPGITIRPIRTLAGERHFCEVFYDNVRIPLANVVGEVGAGWSVAMSTLSFERGTAFMAHQLELSRTVEGLAELARRLPGINGRPVLDDDAVAAQIGALRAEVAAMRAMTYMSVSRGLRQETPGPEGTMLALAFAVASQKVHRVVMDVLGERGLQRDAEWEDWVRPYLVSFSHTIAGGTAEIRRNIIGERVLGLPRDPRPAA